MKDGMIMNNKDKDKKKKNKNKKNQGARRGPPAVEQSQRGFHQPFARGPRRGPRRGPQARGLYASWETLGAQGN